MPLGHAGRPQGPVRRAHLRRGAEGDATSAGAGGEAVPAGRLRAQAGRRPPALRPGCAPPRPRPPTSGGPGSRRRARPGQVGCRWAPGGQGAGGCGSGRGGRGHLRAACVAVPTWPSGSRDLQPRRLCPRSSGRSPPPAPPTAGRCRRAPPAACGASGRSPSLRPESALRSFRSAPMPPLPGSPPGNWPALWKSDSCKGLHCCTNSPTFWIL